MQVVIIKLPGTVQELTSSAEMDFKSPYHIAALFITAICVYPDNKEVCFHMIDFLKGPQKLSKLEKQFINGHMIGKARYIGKSYFYGAKPFNDYTPFLPYTIIIEDGHDAYTEAGYITVYLFSGGSNFPRPIKLRKKQDSWFLWEYTEILTDICKPLSSDP